MCRNWEDFFSCYVTPKQNVYWVPWEALTNGEDCNGGCGLFVTPCNLFGVHWLFGGTFLLYVQFVAALCYPSYE